MRKIPSQRTPWMQGRRSWQQSQKTEGSPGKTSFRVLIWLTTVSEPGQPSKRSTMTPKRPHCTPMSQQIRLLISCFWNGKPPHKTRHRRVKRQCGDTESTWQFYRWGTRCGNWLPEERQSRWPGWHPHWTNQTFWTDCSKVAPLAVQQLCNPLPATQNMAARLGLSQSWNLGKIHMK